MRNIDARVTGYDYTTFHTYTTEVEVDGRTWTLNIRYNTFYHFYERLVAIEKYFTANFPPKGGLFFSPAPEERQEQLDEFIVSTLAYFDMRRHPKRMEALLNKLFQISEHLGIKDDEEERTASEGSFEEHEDDLESDPSLLIGQDDNKTEVVIEVDNQGLQSEVEMEATTQDALEIDLVELQTKPEKVEANEVRQQGHAKEDRPQQQTGTKTLVNGAIVSTMKEPFNKSEAVKVDKITEEQQSAMEDKVMKVAVEIQQKEAAKVEITEEQQDKAMEVEVEMQQNEAAVTEVEDKPVAPRVEKKTTTHGDRVKAPTIQDTMVPLTDPKIHVREPVAPIDADHENVPETLIELDAISLLVPQVEEKPIEEHESSLEDDSEEPDLEPCNMETEPENPMVGWFRRIITFGSSPEENEETEAVEKQEEPEVVVKQEEPEVVEKQEATAQVETAATKTEACMKAEEEVKAEAIETKLLLAAQELNLRLRRYRHPIFFRSFNHDVGFSCFFLPQRSSSDVFV